MRLYGFRVISLYGWEVYAPYDRITVNRMTA